MKNKSLLFLLLAGTALAAACEKNAGPLPAVTSREITFGLSGDGDTFTKGADPVTLDNLGTLYVSAITDSGYAFQNAEFTDDGEGTWKGGKYWPVTNPFYSFAASNISMEGDSTHPYVDVNTGTDVVADYLATPVFQAENALQLQHIFAQVATVTMKAPDGYTVTDVKLWLRPVEQGRYYLDDRTWDPGTPADEDVYIFGSADAGVDLGTGGSYSSEDNDLWLVPGDYTVTATYTISKDAFSGTKTATATVSFAQGYNNHIGLEGDAPNIPLPGDIHELTLTVSVSDWDEQYVTASFTEQ